MPVIKLKDLLLETSVWPIYAGHGTKRTRVTTGKLGKINPTTHKKIGRMPGHPPSTEYTLTPDEEEYLAKLPRKERSNFLIRKLRQSRVEKGRCTRCNASVPLGPGETKRKLCCPDCNKKLVNRAIRKWERRMEMGLCVHCGNSKSNQLDKMCDKCREKLSSAGRKRAEELMAMGICPRCKKDQLDVLAGGGIATACRACRDKARDKFLARYYSRAKSPPLDWSIEENENRD